MYYLKNKNDEQNLPSPQSMMNKTVKLCLLFTPLSLTAAAAAAAASSESFLQAIPVPGFAGSSRGASLYYYHQGTFCSLPKSSLSTPQNPGHTRRKPLPPPFQVGPSQSCSLRKQPWCSLSILAPPPNLGDVKPVSLLSGSPNRASLRFPTLQVLYSEPRPHRPASGPARADPGFSSGKGTPVETMVGKLSSPAPLKVSAHSLVTRRRNTRLQDHIS